MAALPSAEDAARHILSCFAEKSSRPGDALRGNNFLLAFSRDPWRGSDYGAGANYALEQGWVEHGSAGALKLTEVGFSEM
jgi:hypothetical protein